MIGYQPVYHRAHLGQQAPVLPPAPPAAAPAPAPAPAAAPMGGFLDTLKWAAIGFGAGALTGFTLAKTGVVGGDKSGVNGSLLGGLGGLAASVLPKVLGIGG